MIRLDAASLRPTMPLPTRHYLHSEFVSPRNIDVWFPPSALGEGERRYPVLYMHDGQNLFDPKDSFIGVAWQVDLALTRLVGGGRAREAIIVGVWNTPERVAEYMPQRPFETHLNGHQQTALVDEYGTPKGDAYVRFLVEELKPMVDATYPTAPEREHTLVMGSSMGGLISLYALCERPEVFFAAACLSTHWPAADGVVVDYLAESLPQPGSHRLYFDHGTATLDGEYAPYQARVDVIMADAGYKAGHDWTTRIFPGEEHSERAWCRRVEIPLAFLLG